MMDTKVVSKFEPKPIRDLLKQSGWTEGEIGRADYFLFLDHSILTVSIVRRSASRLVSEILDSRIQDTLAGLKKLGEVILVAEGNISMTSDNQISVEGRPMKIHWASLQALLLSLQRQGIMIFWTNTTQESANTILAISNHYQKDNHFIIRQKPSLLFDVTPQIELLTALPGVSIEIAMRLLASYDCPAMALNAILEGEEIPFLQKSYANRIRQILSTHD